MSRWGTEPPFDGQVMVTITYLHQGRSLDVDNVPKPILDALKGLVYSDDAQVTDLLCRKRDLNEPLRVPFASSMLTEAYLQSELSVHVSVEEALSQEATK